MPLIIGYTFINAENVPAACGCFEKPMRLKPDFKLIFPIVSTALPGMLITVSETALLFIIYPLPAFRVDSVPSAALKKLPAAALNK